MRVSEEGCISRKWKARGCREIKHLHHRNIFYLFFSLPRRRRCTYICLGEPWILNLKCPPWFACTAWTCCAVPCRAGEQSCRSHLVTLQLYWNWDIFNWNRLVPSIYIMPRCSPCLQGTRCMYMYILSLWLVFSVLIFFFFFFLGTEIAWCPSFTSLDHCSVFREPDSCRFWVGIFWVGIFCSYSVYLYIWTQWLKITGSFMQQQS